MFYKKYYSQTFLINKNIIKKILDYLKYIKKNKYNYLLEIGAGIGNLSEGLSKINKKYIIIEIDRRFIKILKIKFKQSNIQIYNKNILNINLNKLKKNKKFLIIGNYPYNISSKLILWIINNRNNIIGCIGMFQKEFINNLILNKKIKSKLSFFFNIFFKIKKKIIISKNNFYPRPKIDSMLVLIKKRKKKTKYNNINFNILFLLIKEIFKYKRKILKNCLKIIVKNNIISLKKKILFKRPEDITIDEYLLLYNKLYNKIN
ncbi:MAG: 16S rRNA (adenine(1518)-N(6)/adenine(1519)-N(6))-dimethyltransferase RsmA [Candidatus Shikimatogenerans bostrichidophilus]|nr:MAG: 16S rRNA (adenine(1518)-N(6)/adenine(1519)-N(6))-dimethyltransferase RsmA [Candidatus Shikimatogenerans bostrichidophilus]